MSSRTWKITSVILVLLIVGMFVFTQGFHYVVQDGYAYPLSGSGNGTLIVVESLTNVDVRVNASFSFTGMANGPGEILLENGTSYVVNNSHPNAYILGTINGEWFSASTSGYFYFDVNLSSNGNPVAIAVVYDYPYSEFNSNSLQSKLSGLNYFAFFVFNYSTFQVRAVAMPL